MAVKLLIVEEDPMVCAWWKAHQGGTWDIRAASSVMQALEQVDGDTQAVFVDAHTLTLGGMERAHQLLREARALAPVFVYSSARGKGGLARLLAGQATGFLASPFRFSTAAKLALGQMHDSVTDLEDTTLVAPLANPGCSSAGTAPGVDRL